MLAAIRSNAAMTYARILALLISLLMVTTTADAGGHRSSWARTAFKRMHPCPATGSPHGRCPGYVIDHLIPLACGGLDAPENMQWQTRAEAREKDRWERRGCGGGARHSGYAR